MYFAMRRMSPIIYVVHDLLTLFMVNVVLYEEIRGYSERYKCDVECYVSRVKWEYR